VLKLFINEDIREGWEVGYRKSKRKMLSVENSRLNRKSVMPERRTYLNLSNSPSRQTYKSSLH